MSILRALLLTAVLLLVSCETVLPAPVPPQEIKETDDRILIVDQDGKEWDVTDAVNRYGMQPHLFHHGLGKDFIPPLHFPLMLEPGDPGYPDDDTPFRVAAGVINGDARAYRTLDLDRHEVVNELIGGEKVLVGW